MQIVSLDDKRLNQFILFSKKYLSKSFVYHPKFLKHWFTQKKKKWTIDLVLNENNQILSINLHIKNKVLFKNKIKNLAWTSTAFTKIKDKTRSRINFNYNSIVEYII